MPFGAFSGRGWLFSFLPKDQNRMKHRGPPCDVGVVCWCLARSLLSGAHQRRLVLSRRLPRRAGRRRIVRGSDRTMRHRVPARSTASRTGLPRPAREPESFLMTTGCARPLEDRRASPMANACAGRAPATASMRSTLTCFSATQDAPGSETWSIRATVGASIIRKYLAS